MHVVNAFYPTQDQMMSFFSAPDDGPFVMVNLLKFREKAAYPDGSEPALSGREAYQRYGNAVAALVEELGGRVRYSGAVTGLMIGACDPLWDMVALAEYPSLAAFQGMATSAAYRAIEHHRTAGLEGQLNIRTRPGLDRF